MTILVFLIKPVSLCLATLVCVCLLIQYDPRWEETVNRERMWEVLPVCLRVSESEREKERNRGIKGEVRVESARNNHEKQRHRGKARRKKKKKEKKKRDRYKMR